jgi:hypothetical protein
MHLLNQENLKLIAYEAFIRRASELNLPFMLKGSYVTRQYFPDSHLRKPNDLDWLYMLPLGSAEEAERVFTEWAVGATELVADDSVRFRSFRENAFYRAASLASSLEAAPNAGTATIQRLIRPSAFAAPCQFHVHCAAAGAYCLGPGVRC